MLKSALGHPFLRALVVVLAMVSACTGAELRTPYTESELQTALPMGIPAVRTWADAPLSVLRPQVAHLPIFNGSGEFSILALSGGGEHGAFGAGLLNGWSQSGQRPTFSIVTGISTGALMAPFAFLGSAYDQRLKALYTDNGASKTSLEGAAKTQAGSLPPNTVAEVETVRVSRALHGRVMDRENHAISLL
jgi:predicted acylesterase/phospholipase RssA